MAKIKFRPKCAAWGCTGPRQWEVWYYAGDESGCYNACDEHVTMMRQIMTEAYGDYTLSRPKADAETPTD